jgi:hypothetical protein
MANPSVNSGQAAMGSDPLQPAALTAIGHWLLVIGNCGSTGLATGRSTQRPSTGGSTKVAVIKLKELAQARRPRPVQAGRLRSVAGPGGACLRAAA